MKKYTLILKITFAFILLVFITSCTNGELNEKESSKNTKENITRNEDINKNLEEEPTQSEADLLEIAPEEPTTLEEIVAYPSGPLAGWKEEDGKYYEHDYEYMYSYVKDVLPPIEENVDKAYLDKWWRAYRLLFAHDYPDPRTAIKQLSFESFGHPGLEDERFQFKDQMNVLVILDVSGSMANEINGKSMMDIAKDSINEFVSDLPEDVNIGLRVYGHEGKRTGKTKEESCKSTELVYDIQPLDKQEFMSVIEPFEPTGWTPIGLSLEKVKEDFKEFPSDKNTNLVYVVSDGAETCGGDPVKAAEELVDSDIEPIINVIGFNVDIEGQSHLREIADAGGGVYTNAGNEEQLQEAFNQAEELLERWREWKNGARLDLYHDRNGQESELHEMKMDWAVFDSSESVTLRNVLVQLAVEDYITSEAYDYMEEKAKKRDELFQQIKDTEFEELSQEIEKQYEQMLKKIEEEYKDQTK